MRKFKIPLKIIPMVLCIFLLGILLYLFFLRTRAAVLGEKLGTNMGIVSGKVIGSIEGMTKGRAEGTEAGKQEGLSAKDTTATITSQIRQMENLEVLVASVKLRNFHTIGVNTSYAALYLANGSVVFSVDLSKASITAENGELTITLPMPEGNLYIDESTITKVAEYQKRYFTGSAEDGFDAYLNTMAQMQKASEETLDNYEALLTSAKKAAENQLKMLVRAVSVDVNEIVIAWDEEG